MVEAMTPQAALLAKEATDHLTPGAIPEAETSFRKAAALAPGDPSLSIGLAALYNLTGHGDTAFSLLKDLALVDPM